MPRPFPEELLQTLWLRGIFDPFALRTRCGLPVRIIRPGRPNPNEGPDLEEAELYIGGLRWVGAIEFHLRSSDWARHGHHRDGRYNSVILHVVWQADGAPGANHRADGSPLPELVLEPCVPASIGALLPRLNRMSQRPYCAPDWERLDRWEAIAILEKLHLARFLEKAHRFRALQEQLRGKTPTPWREALWQLLAEGLGYSANREPMRLLADRVPLKRLSPLPTPLAREALLFGTAGWLPLPGTGAYPEALRTTWEAISDKPEPLPRSLWRTRRLRPANHPIRRIAQAAAIAERLLQEDFEHRARRAVQGGTAALRQLLQVRPSEYWQPIPLGGPSTARTSGLGRERLDSLLANALLPALWHLEVEERPENWAERLIALYRTLPLHGLNRITRHFAHSPFDPRTEADAQALHHLYATFCLQRGCLSCPVAARLYGI
jgi:hypothetical protein|nr:MAG: hypothetical protein KatS3mg041_1078 [Bacteroidota bacterium]